MRVAAWADGVAVIAPTRRGQVARCSSMVAILRKSLRSCSGATRSAAITAITIGSANSSERLGSERDQCMRFSLLGIWRQWDGFGRELAHEVDRLREAACDRFLGRVRSERGAFNPDHPH